MANDSIGLDGSLVEGLFREKGALAALLQAVCRAAMEQEVTRHVGAGLHERSESRVGRRNGYKPRTLRTRAGDLELDVPQVRGCEPYHPSLFGKWQRSERALLVACAEMYFQGVSTRNVREVLEAMCDGDVSATTVSQVARELDEKVAAFRGRRLDGHEYPYVKVDARYEKVRVDGRVVSQAVLVTMGYTEQGRREVLDFRLGDSESESTWSGVFVDLKGRGLKGVRLLVSDAHAGIVAAARRHLQGVAWQRCRVHFMRELARKVSYKQAKELMKEARAVFEGATRRECLLRAEGMALRWEPGNAGVSRLLREGLEDCLAVLDFPEDHRRRLASTNELENLMRRLKKRTRVVGVFPSRSSCERLIGSQLLEVHEQWLTESTPRFNMELAAPAAAR
jgi:transposase-like protein